MSRVSLDTFPFSPSQLSVLHNSGFNFAEDLERISPSDLAEELECTIEKAHDILKIYKAFSGKESKQDSSEISQQFKEVQLSHKFQSTSAWELLQHHASMPTIPTLCEELDTALGKGIPFGTITEFCGSPGTGKTQIAMQLCLAVQLPAFHCGESPEAVYIDTEGSFMPDRVEAMAKSLVSSIPECPSIEVLLSRIFVFRTHTHTTLIATIKSMTQFLQSHPNVRLVVVDSISACLRHAFTNDGQQRMRIIHDIGSSLQNIARQNNVAVVCTNQVTTKPFPSSSTASSSSSSSSPSPPSPSPLPFGTSQSGEARLVPALGDSWTQSVTHRIALKMCLDPSTQLPIRIATVLKSPVSVFSLSIPFVITEQGLRSASTMELSSIQTLSPTPHSPRSPPKTSQRISSPIGDE
ncbi:DNA repair protein RAD51, RAD51C [Monocercomonoides exilis]|uniref:DNA repair protein RAD51, RAD51C n=1 Tax=Monocercomonoides exilis TaxID=2049356 RepID=UPI0035597028|nr:DNA repair protein RAD51, RAD51C [Monocercomonoides exilis]|eukprot:MONOS_13360.1-p1 / transcript=MONOS_13360.1 / gene=MONOS_13360 / organism=Monocercomonoides_exilis_PA203 / gene_product=DNA repair protein RAD51 homolog 3, RAD51C, putative / transcript_product=DNA repair protein RAD51 homolog 3, RAD51C, putative / location=Mono_scaffold00816:15725-17324(+) / protein_length=409 / sequence_SO=supercontig / SO=protein_coding / is_pseudo=false